MSGIRFESSAGGGGPGWQGSAGAVRIAVDPLLTVNYACLFVPDLNDDSVFAVKDKLIVNFNPIPASYQAPAGLEGKMKYELEYNIYLSKETKEHNAQVESSVGLAIAQQQ